VPKSIQKIKKKTGRGDKGSVPSEGGVNCQKRNSIVARVKTRKCIARWDWGGEKVVVSAGELTKVSTSRDGGGTVFSYSFPEHNILNLSQRRKRAVPSQAAINR